MDDAATFLDLSKLLLLREVLGPLYGSEDLCVLLYSLVRREKPQTIVELGTGLGVSTLWMAQAMRENGNGHIFTIDDGQHSPPLMTFLRQNKERLQPIVQPDGLAYPDYLQQLIGNCGLADQVTYRCATASPNADDMLPPEACDFGPHPIDLLFSDFDHSPETIMDILAFFLPRMAECASIFIDSASTRLSSFLMLERLVAQLNKGKVPHGFLTVKSGPQREALVRIVAQRQFRLTHLIERKNRSQNSTAWLRIEPSDWRPHPLAKMH